MLVPHNQDIQKTSRVLSANEANPRSDVNNIKTVPNSGRSCSMGQEHSTHSEAQEHVVRAILPATGQLVRVGQLANAARCFTPPFFPRGFTTCITGRSPTRPYDNSGIAHCKMHAVSCPPHSFAAPNGPMVASAATHKRPSILASPARWLPSAAIRWQQTARTPHTTQVEHALPICLDACVLHPLHPTPFLAVARCPPGSPGRCLADLTRRLAIQEAPRRTTRRTSDLRQVYCYLSVHLRAPVVHLHLTFPISHGCRLQRLLRNALSIPSPYSNYVRRSTGPPILAARRRCLAKLRQLRLFVNSL